MISEVLLHLREGQQNLWQPDIGVAEFQVAALRNLTGLPKPSTLDLCTSKQKNPTEFLSSRVLALGSSEFRACRACRPPRKA